jgi:hypothetical protein
MEPIAAAARWARVWHDAWEGQDPEAIVALYAPDVLFSTQAFRVPRAAGGLGPVDRLVRCCGCLKARAAA